MGIFGFGKALFPQTTGFKDMVAQYQRLRPTRLRLNNELVRKLSRDALYEGAKKIGVLRGGMFVFDNEDESSVLMDYCIYNVYRKGCNAVEQHLSDCPPDPDSDEMVCLHAMRDATYTLIAVLRVEPGVGCQIRNLLTNETRLLIDIGFSQTAQCGAIVVTRLLDFGDYVTTSGSPLPMGILDNDELEKWRRKLCAGVSDPSLAPATLIRACLQGGASSRVRYEEANTQRRFDVGEGVPPARISAQEKRALIKQHASNASTNRRCRCGSGKMFRNCCGKR